MTSFSFFGTMCMLLMLQSLFSGHRAYDLSCGADSDPCPPQTKCVPGAGCVSLEAHPDCRCKQLPCPWSQKCDCRGGCEPLKCSADGGCGRQLINPRNPCQQLNCSVSSNTCNVVPVQCAGNARCDRVRGCRPVATSGAGNAESVSVDEADQQQQEQQKQHSASNVHINDVATGWTGWTIGILVFVVVFSAAWVAAGLYAMYLAWNPSTRPKGNL